MGSRGRRARGSIFFYTQFFHFIRLPKKKSSKIAILARLEQDGQQPRFTRGRGAKRGAPRGGAGGNRHRKEMDPSTRQCNICEVFGHTWLECPKGIKTMQKKEIARRAERQTRNGARALRRAALAGATAPLGGTSRILSASRGRGRGKK